MKALLLAILLTAVQVQAQTSQQMEYERQQREYRQQMERQAEQQRQQQKIMEENARRQQEEQNRLNRPPATPPNYSAPTPAPNYGGGTRPQAPQQPSTGSSTRTVPTGPAPAAPAPPKSWIKVTTTAAARTLFADPTTIKRLGNTRLMVSVWNYRRYETTSGKSYLSSRVLSEYDCKNHRLRTISYTSHSQHNAQGVIVSRSTPDTISTSWYAPQSYQVSLLKIACGG